MPKKPRLPANLTGDGEFFEAFDASSDFTSVKIDVPDFESLVGIISEWGETLPYSSYPGFFRALIEDSDGRTQYRTIGLWMPTLSQAAQTALDKLDTLHPDSMPAYWGEISSLEVNYKGPKKAIKLSRHELLSEKAKRQPRRNGKFVKPSTSRLSEKAKQQPRYVRGPKKGQFKPKRKRKKK